MEEPLGLLMVLPGSFAIAGGLFNWDWFMNARKARMVAKLMGRSGSKIFYFLLGSTITVLGFLINFGIIS